MTRFVLGLLVVLLLVGMVGAVIAQDRGGGDVEDRAYVGGGGPPGSRPCGSYFDPWKGKWMCWCVYCWRSGRCERRVKVCP